MNQGLTHILDQSVCLTRRQLRDYLSGGMLPIEAHAVEVHLSSCPLCSMAMEGFEEHSEEALLAIESLNSGFIREHFANIAPQIHLNSMAPAMAAPSRPRKTFAFPLWRVGGIAAAAVLAIGLFFFINNAVRETPRVLSDAGSERAQTAPAVAPVQAEAIASDMQPDGPMAEGDHAAVNEPAYNAAPHAKESADDDHDRSATADEFASKPAPAKTDVSQAGLAGNGVARKDASPAVADEAVPSPESLASAAPSDAEIEAKKREKAQISGPLQSRPAAARSVAPPSGEARSDASETSASAKESAPSPMEAGDAAFQKGRYSVALRHYRTQMASGDKTVRNNARLMAAQCYAALGNREKAQQLLEPLTQDGTGRQRRQARRALRALQE